MRIAICVDKLGGVLFNGRRVSQDSVLREKLFSFLADGEDLCMNSYSAKQFGESEKIKCDENFLNNATDRDLCFVETDTVPLEKTEELYLFNWNRQYPADTFFEFDAKTAGFKKAEKQEFEGSSHKKITLIIYRRIPS